MHSFKRVLKTLLAFFLMLAVLSLALAEFYLNTEYCYYQDSKERNDLAGTLDTLYCGASFALRAFRPDRIDPVLGTHGYNLSSSRMTMRGRYTLLERELQRNEIKTVVLEVSCDTMTRCTPEEGPEGELILFTRLSIRNRVGYLLSAIPISDYPTAYFDVVSKGLSGVISLCTGTVRLGNWQLTQGYFPYSEPDEWFDVDYSSLYHTSTLPTVYWDENLLWLDRIRDLCAEHGAELVLVNVPQSRSFNCKYDNLDVFDGWYRAYCAENGLRYFNFNLYRGIGTLLPDRGCFYDLYHLNNEGAERFSALYAEILSRANAGEDVGALFYDSYAAWEQDAGFGALEGG